MQSEPEQDKEEFEDDLQTFEEKPEEDKELLHLEKDQEKSIGEDLAEVNEEIEEKTDS